MEVERRAGWGKDAVWNKGAEPRVYARERRVLRLCVCVFFCNCGGAWITLLCSDLAEFRLFRYVCSFSLPFDDFEVTFCAQNNCLSMFLPGSNRLRCRRSWFCTSYSLVIASYRICRHCFFFLFVMLLFSIAWMAAVYAPSFNRSRFDKFFRLECPRSKSFRVYCGVSSSRHSRRRLKKPVWHEWLCKGLGRVLCSVVRVSSSGHLRRRLKKPACGINDSARA